MPKAHTAASVSWLDPVQFLYAERHDEEKNADPQLRRADVYYYEYATDTVILRVIDVRTGAIDSEVRYQGRQPAISAAETTAAVQLLLDDSQLGPVLRKLHRIARGTELVSATDIRANAGIFFADSALGTPLEPVTRACAIHRCVQLFLPYDDSHFIDTSALVIDLSSGQVIWVDAALTAIVDGTPFRVINDIVTSVAPH